METLSTHHHDKDYINENFSWLLAMMDYHVQQKQRLKKLIHPEVMSAGIEREIIDHDILVNKYYTALANKYLISFTVKDTRISGYHMRKFISNHRKLHHQYKR